MHKFERNAAHPHGTDIPNLTTEFVQYAADNVDHNICTLDGHGTFHEALEKKNCETHHASGDADLLIVLKVVRSATTTSTVLVGDDTDLIVLLCYYAS